MESVESTKTAGVGDGVATHPGADFDVMPVRETSAAPLDLATIVVGTRLEHRISTGWVPITITSVPGGCYSYVYEAGRYAGQIMSCSPREMRRAARFRRRAALGATVETVPLVVPEVRPAPAPPNALRKLPVAAPPMVVNGDGNEVRLGDHAISVYIFRARPCVVAKDLGAALDYGDEGKHLADSITGNWSSEMVPGRDFAVLEGDELRDFKAIAALGGAPPPSRARSLMVLFETGMDLACQKAKTEKGAALRRYLADEVLPKLRRGEPPRAISAAATPAAPPPQALVEVTQLANAVASMANTLRETMASLPRLVSDTVQAALDTRALPPSIGAQPVVLIPLDWRSADQLALILTGRLRQTVTPARVHKIIRERTSVRSDANLARQRPSITVDPSTGFRRENPQWWYAPAVLDVVEQILLTPDTGAAVGAHRDVDEGHVSARETRIRDNGRPSEDA